MDGKIFGTPDDELDSVINDRMKEIMSDSKTKTYFIVISAKNLIYNYLVVIVVPYKGG